MDVLRYTSDGLITFAAECEHHAAEVMSGGPPTPLGGPAQATIAAVSALHDDAVATAEVLSGRIRSTSAAVQSTAFHLARAEELSADALAADGGGCCGG